ncbi:MAG: hypothetical protein L6R40_004538 [Gallowayella cf. fulva]|nr:MAG: hypothetical protein L6R40_004538 [Xanthomendoza cf. fulva]
MGTAILQGLLSSTRNVERPSVKYTALVRSQSSLERLHSTLGENRKLVNCVAGGNIVDAIRSADIVILGFPPGELQAVFDTAGLVDTLGGKLVISLLAGVSSSQLQAAAGVPYFHSLRVIPSIGAKINDSVTLIAETASVSPEQHQAATWLFEHMGQIQWLSESLMDEATAAGAACNALTMVAVDAIVDASVAEGIPRLAAMKLAAASLRSSSGLLLGGGMTPESLKESMSVPKGITINSVLALERGHVRSAISDTVRHAIQYTRNM